MLLELLRPANKQRVEPRAVLLSKPPALRDRGVILFTRGQGKMTEDERRNFEYDYRRLIHNSVDSNELQAVVRQILEYLLKQNDSE